MQIRPEIAGECSRCGASIYSGNACVLIDQSTERFEDEQVVIDECRILQKFCARCGNSLQSEWLRNELTRGRALPPELQLEQEGAEAEGVPCDVCGRPLPEGEAYIAINRSVGQLGWNGSLQMGEIVTIDSETLTTLCRGCGSHLDPGWLDRYVASPLWSEELVWSPVSGWQREHRRSPPGTTRLGDDSPRSPAAQDVDGE
jgi:hypothetical protein